MCFVTHVHVYMYKLTKIKVIFRKFQTPPTVRRRVEGTGTLPREMERVQGTMPKKKGFASWGKGLFRFRGASKWSTSAPNLGDGWHAYVS